MNDLARKIEAALNEALDRQVAAEMYACSDDDRGLAARLPGEGSPGLYLTVEDVARIAAATALAWF